MRVSLPSNLSMQGINSIQYTIGRTCSASCRAFLWKLLKLSIEFLLFKISRYVIKSRNKPKQICPLLCYTVLRRDH